MQSTQAVLGVDWTEPVLCCWAEHVQHLCERGALCTFPFNPSQSSDGCNAVKTEHHKVLADNTSCRDQFEQGIWLLLPWADLSIQISPPRTIKISWEIESCAYCNNEAALEARSCSWIFIQAGAQTWAAGCARDGFRPWRAGHSQPQGHVSMRLFVSVMGINYLFFKG